MRDPTHDSTNARGHRRDGGLDPNDLRAGFERLLESARTNLEVRLKPAVERSPLRAVSQAAALGFVLGIVVPVRLQLLVLAPAIRAGVRRVLAAKGAGSAPRGGAPAVRAPAGRG